jgi:pimeloyl-ACP methyl ester carboxylesterase
VESSITAKTQFLDVRDDRYAYRRLGNGPALPLLLLQHFTGTLDNWDPALVDTMAETREVILFDNAGIGYSAGTVPSTVGGMTKHVTRFLNGVGIFQCDVLGFSLGGMIAQQLAQDHPSLVRRLILVATAPRGGEDIMHIEKPNLTQFFGDPNLKGYDILQKIFFAPTYTSQAAGAAFVNRLKRRTNDRDRPSGPEVAQAQLVAFRDWEQFEGERFAELQKIHQQVLVATGVRDAMIPVRNSYFLGENLPNAVLVTFPDSGHGALFQYHDSFARLAIAFLDCTQL